VFPERSWRRRRLNAKLLHRVGDLGNSNGDRKQLWRTVEGDVRYAKSGIEPCPHSRSGGVARSPRPRGEGANGAPHRLPLFAVCYDTGVTSHDIRNPSLSRTRSALDVDRRYPGSCSVLVRRTLRRGALTSSVWPAWFSCFLRAGPRRPSTQQRLRPLCRRSSRTPDMFPII
jgi:hypothetical protein